MKKHSKIKIFLTVVLIIAVIAVGYWLLRSNRDYFINNSPNSKTTTENTNKDQYSLSYSNSGNLVQTIHLNKGTAAFDIAYEGDSDFLVTIFTNEGKLIGTLAQEKSAFRGRKTIDVPETDAYLLDVKTKGKWDITYK